MLVVNLIPETTRTINQTNVVQSIRDTRIGTYYIPKSDQEVFILTNREKDTQISGLTMDNRWLEMYPFMSKLPSPVANETLRLLRCENLIAVHVELSEDTGWLTVEWSKPRKIELSKHGIMGIHLSNP
jgi:hypothetical protein